MRFGSPQGFLSIMFRRTQLWNHFEHYQHISTYQHILTIEINKVMHISKSSDASKKSFNILPWIVAFPLPASQSWLLARFRSSILHPDLVPGHGNLWCCRKATGKPPAATSFGELSFLRIPETVAAPWTIQWLWYWRCISRGTCLWNQNSMSKK